MTTKNAHELVWKKFPKLPFVKLAALANIAYWAASYRETPEYEVELRIRFSVRRQCWLDAWKLIKET